MASTTNIPLADLTRHHGGHDPSGSLHGQLQSSMSRDSVPTDTRDTESAWHTEQQLPANIGEREQVNLPRADGGKEAWLFLCGCFTIEALVWGRSELSISDCCASIMGFAVCLRALLKGFFDPKITAPHFLFHSQLSHGLNIVKSFPSNGSPYLNFL